MTALIIIAAALLILLAALFIPASLTAEYRSIFSLRLRFLGVPVKLLPKRKKYKKKKKKRRSVKEEPPEKKPLEIKKIIKLASFAKGELSRAGKLISRIKIRDFEFLLSVGGEDASAVAVGYGAVCAAVYPAFRLLCSLCDVKAKRFDVRSDFSGGKTSAEFSIRVSASPVFLLAAAFGIYKDYLSFGEEEQNERREH